MKYHVCKDLAQLLELVTDTGRSDRICRYELLLLTWAEKWEFALHERSSVIHAECEYSSLLSIVARHGRDDSDFTLRASTRGVKKQREVV